MAQPTSVPSSAQALQQQFTPPNSQGHPQAQQFTQRSSPSTSANATPSTQSPTSINNGPTPSQVPLAQRQIRPPKSPMYIPAALRPTDRPPRASPLTPPRSLHGSTDSLDNNPDPTRPASRRSTDPGKSRQALDRVSETSSHDETAHPTQTEPEDDMSDLIALNGDPPTRHHWKADAFASICDGPICQRSFGLFERRHHCRHCGNIFCKEHSSLQIPLDQNADFHPRGIMVRSCGHCHSRYKEWMEERKQRKKGNSFSALDQNSPIRLIGGKSPKSPETQKSSVAGSVTRDWNWSTF